MNIVSTLNEKLLKQPFSTEEEELVILARYQQIACGYAEVENTIAVLSDLRANRSYIYHGGFAEQLNIAVKGSVKEINSIWEKDIFDRIHPDDLLKKHTFELQFFHWLKNIPVEERSRYYVTGKMRMKNDKDVFVPVQHRMFYVRNGVSGNLWLSLCLYHFSTEPFREGAPYGIIINSITGELLVPERGKPSTILTRRELAVLELIGKGKMSKEIADILSVSIHTVNRHRQNILEKLRVKNSIEAYRIAELMGLLALYGNKNGATDITSTTP